MSSGNSDQSSTRILIGRIAGAHGLRGLVKLRFFDFDPMKDPALLSGAVFTSKSGNETVSITLKNPNGKFYLAEIEGVSNRNASEAIKGTEL